MIPPWYLTTSIPAIHFFYGTAIISREHLKRFIMPGALCLFCNNYCNHPLQWEVCGWFEKNWSVLTVFIWESNCSPAPLKVFIYSTELVPVIFVCSHTHSFRVNVLIWQARFYWFELAVIHNISYENVYSLSAENIQGQA